MRHTKIIATIGPATESQEQMEKLLAAGVDIFRFNFSHGDHLWFHAAFANARKASEKIGKPVEFLLDTKGPEIRTGDLAKPLMLSKGDVVTFTIHEAEQNPSEKRIFVAYADIVLDLVPGNIIELDNGLFEAKVLEVQKDFFTVEILSDGVLGSRKHINLPGVRVRLATITEKDKHDIAFGLQEGIHWIALSFTRKPEDIEQTRALCLLAGHSEVKVCAKIENQEGIQNFDAILMSSDAIMVARGDLGVEMPFERIPSLQKIILRKTVAAQKFSIVATQMLSSMTAHPMPTRAEVSDIATAVWEKADAVMLSEETAVGKYPIQAVNVMGRVIDATEEELKKEALE
jgi:pyruvate kinase